MKFIKLKGRIGNNLFQYALYYKLKKKYNISVFVYGWNPDFEKYFEKVNWIDSFYFRKLVHKAIKFFPNKTFTQYDFQPLAQIDKEIENNLVLDGYFQSAQFFEGYEDLIKNNFKIKKKYIKEFEKRFAKLYKENKILVINYRLGDYVNWGNDSLGGKNLVLPLDYYKNALAKIADIDSFKIILVTDEKQVAKEHFSFIQNIEVFSEGAIIDFQLIKNSHTIIIANSTFSWWAAYLSRTAKRILAPEFFVGFKIKKDFPEGIYNNTNFEIVCFDKL